ncbi:MAG: hypothetical protein U1F98_06345 [Verrucomicrobiota bacterium]
MLDHEFVAAKEESSSHRLMIMLHGLGDSLEGYRWLQDAMDLPWMNYLLVNAPDEYYDGFSWFDFEADIRPGVKRSLSQLVELIEAWDARGFPVEQAVLGGFSQGCLMAIETGCRYPRRFAGIVGISGFVCHPEDLVKELSPIARNQRFLITHGRQDPLIRFDEAHRHVRVLESAGLDIDFREFQKQHTIAGEDELEIIRNFIRAGYAA